MNRLSENEHRDLMEEIKFEVERNKKLKKQLWYSLTEFLLSLTGYSILLYSLGWLPVLGLLLIQTSGNMQLLRTIYENKENIWKNIWKP